MELYKLMRNRPLMLSMAALIIFSLLLQLGFRYQNRNPLVRIAKRGDMDLQLVWNAINSTRMIVSSCYHLFFPLLAVMVFAGQIAGERSAGTLRVILSRPVSRRSIYTAKFAAAAFSLFVLIVLFVGVSLLFGWLLFGTHDFLSASRVFDLLGGGPSVVLPFSEGVRRFAMTAVLLSYVLLPVGALAFYCSAISRTGLAAMGSALIIFFAVYIVQGLGDTGVLSLFGDISPYLFTHCMESWKFIFTPDIAWGEIMQRSVVSLLYTLALFFAGLLHFHHTDLTE